MAETVGTIIPQDINALELNVQEDIKTVLTEILKYLKESGKKQDGKDQQLRKVIGGDPKAKKRKTKLEEVYEKWFIKNKFFQKVTSGLKTLVDKAGDSLFKMVTGLLIGALVGGDFIASLIDMGSKIIIMLINLAAQHLPRLIKEAIRIVVDVLPKAFIKVVEGLAPAIGNLFFQLLKDTPLQQLGVWLQEAFGPNGAITGFLKSLAPLIPYIIGAWGVLGIVSKVMSGIAMLQPIFSLLLPLITGLGSAIISIIGPLLATAGPFIAIGTALFLLWKYSGKVLEFLNYVPKFLEEKLGIVGKILAVAFNLITYPIKAIVSLFGVIKKIQNKGILKYFKDSWENVKKWGIDTWKNFKKGVSDSFKNLVRGFTSFVQPFFDKVAPVFKTIKDVLTILYDVITGVIAKGFFKIKDAIQDIVDWFGSVSEVGFSSLFTEKGRKEIDREQLIRKAARQEASIRGGNEEVIIRELRSQYSKDNSSKAVVDAIKKLEDRVAKQQGQVNAKRFGSSPTNTQGKK